MPRKPNIQSWLTEQIANTSLTWFTSMDFFEAGEQDGVSRVQITRAMHSLYLKKKVVFTGQTRNLEHGQLVKIYCKVENAPAEWVTANEAPELHEVIMSGVFADLFRKPAPITGVTVKHRLGA